MLNTERSPMAFLAVVLLTLLALLAPSAGARAARTVWGAEYFPDVTLINQDGQTVRFFEDLIKDKVVAINFIFTRCTDTCPLETARLRQVQEILGDRAGRDVFFYSISIDPEHDTPGMLKAYAQRYQAGPGWVFLTGRQADITLLRTKLGLLDPGANARSLKGHGLGLIIGNQATGQWMKRSPFENPYVLAAQLGSWLHNWKQPAPARRDYADAPRVRNLSQGEELFRTRCSACHSIGRESAGAPGQQTIGPNLVDVSLRRERKWLERWLREPDQVLAEKDPQALAMLSQFENVRMPNLHLDEDEVRALLDFIDGESRRHAQHHAPGSLVQEVSP
jgi:mono/diheme cytochrome c family protein